MDKSKVARFLWPAVYNSIILYTALPHQSEAYHTKSKQQANLVWLNKLPCKRPGMWWDLCIDKPTVDLRLTIRWLVKLLHCLR